MKSKKYASYGVLSALTLAVAGAYSMPAAAQGNGDQSPLSSATRISTEDLSRAAQAGGGSDDALARVDVDSGSTHIHADVTSIDARTGGPGSFDV